MWLTVFNLLRSLIGKLKEAFYLLKWQNFEHWDKEYSPVILLVFESWLGQNFVVR